MLLETRTLKCRTISSVCLAAHEGAKEKGWLDSPRSFGEEVALMHSELSEALEDYRAGKRPDEVWLEPSGKPCGIPIELADCVIRIAQFCGSNGIDLETAIIDKMTYNRTRPYRHGNKTI